MIMSFTICMGGGLLSPLCLFEALDIVIRGPPTGIIFFEAVDNDESGAECVGWKDIAVRTPWRYPDVERFRDTQPCLERLSDPITQSYHS